MWAQHHISEQHVVVTNGSKIHWAQEFPEKLIPVVILKAEWQLIPRQRDGSGVSDQLYADDHVEALLVKATRERLGANYSLEGSGERNK